MDDYHRSRHLRALLKSLRSTIQATNRIVPGCSLAALVLAGVVTYVVASSLPLMMAVVVLLVLIAALSVYASTKNYGEATLALAAGLLTAFTVEWNPGSFTAFFFAWVALSLTALLISSVSIAARVEEIISDAAISLGTQDHKGMARELSRISKETETEMLGPVERAEVLRLFAFRMLSLDAMSQGLRATEILHTITGVSHIGVATFIADVYKMFRTEASTRYEPLLNGVYLHIRESPVSPNEFIEAFNDSRHLALSGNMTPENYFSQLRNALDEGVHPADISEYLEKKLG